MSRRAILAAGIVAFLAAGVFLVGPTVFAISEDAAPFPTTAPSGSSSATSPSVNTQSPAPPTTGPENPGTIGADAAARCATNTEDYLHAKVVYPRTLTVALNRGASFQAAIDASGSAPPPEVVIDSPDAQQADIVVQCVVGARLVSTGRDVEVDTPDSDSDGGWRYLQFGPSGIVEWAWTVTPAALGEHELRLELRPAALAVAGGPIVVSRVGEVSFVSRLTATGSWIDWMAEWTNRQWPLLTAGLLAILGTVLTLVAQFRDAFGSRKATTPDQQPAEEAKATGDR